MHYRLKGTTMLRSPKHRPPAHPGEVLLEEILHPPGISQAAFAKRIDVPYVRLNSLINGRRGVSSDAALRLERATGMSAGFWLNLQRDWDLWHALRWPRGWDI